MIMAMPYCIICHNTFIQTEEIASTRCGHVYHSECLTEWFQSSQTCPQCRQYCDSQQINRIYIEFVCDDNFACSRSLIKSRNMPTANSDAEETIKLLLEHIETGPTDSPEKCNQECEYCKMILEAFDCALTEKEKLKQTLNEKETESAILNDKNENALKHIEKLEMTIRANEHNLNELNERIETSERIMAAFQSNNIAKDEQIHYLKLSQQINENELNALHQKVNELTAQMDVIKIDHNTEINQLCETLQNDFKTILPRRILNKFSNKSTQNVDQPLTNTCQTIVPYCGNIDDWEYMMVPILKPSQNKINSFNSRN